MTKADWLRSEIEKLEGMKKEVFSHVSYTPEITHNDVAREQRMSYNQALTSIITRYKEELLELGSKEV